MALPVNLSKERSGAVTRSRGDKEVWLQTIVPILANNKMADMTVIKMEKGED
jgi:hypothetical protein